MEFWAITEWNLKCFWIVYSENKSNHGGVTLVENCYLTIYTLNV